MLDALEAIRIGEPASSLERAVPQCAVSQLEKGHYDCGIVAVGGWYWPKVVPHIIPYEYHLPVIWRLRRLGLQSWYITVYASIPDGRIRSLGANTLVIAGRKSLGAAWELNENMPQRFIGGSSRSADQMRTYIGDVIITNLPGGKGIRIAATPDSDRRELQARHVNRSCLQSFNRCEELCQLLPDAISVLDARGMHWADCAATRSDRLKSRFQQRSHC